MIISLESVCCRCSSVSVEQASVLVYRCLFLAMELALIVVGYGRWVPYNAQIAMLQPSLFDPALT